MIHLKSFIYKYNLEQQNCQKILVIVFQLLKDLPNLNSIQVSICEIENCRNEVIKDFFLRNNKLINVELCTIIRWNQFEWRGTSELLFCFKKKYINTFSKSL